jgi:hypothetical protein
MIENTGPWHVKEYLLVDLRVIANCIINIYFCEGDV